MFAARGIPVDQFGPRLSFFLDCGLDAEYIALARVSRRTNRPLLKGQDDSALGTDAGGDTLLGYKVVIDQAFPDIAANSTTNWGVFGDIHEAYVVRRALCRLTPKNYNTIFPRLAAVARETNGSLEALSAAFLEYKGPSNRFPSDDELREAFRGYERGKR